MRVAVIGAGSMGGRHAALLATLPDVEELLVVDAIAERAEAVAAAMGGRALSHDAALDAADAVVVATPAGLHAATVAAAVARRLPTLCEKPLTDDLATSAALARRIESAGAHVEVGFHRRHDPAYAAGRARVADGSAGRVHLLRLTAYDPRVPAPAALDGPAPEVAPLFLHSSIHDFDFVRWMTGQELEEVAVEGSARDGSRPADPRLVESAVVTMRCSGGTIAVLTGSLLDPLGYDSRVELLADGASLVMGFTDRTPVEHLDAEGAATAAAAPWSGYLDRFDAAYRAELVAFLGAARGERPPATTARDGLEAHRIAAAATRAHLERRPVSLDEIAVDAEVEVARR